MIALRDLLTRLQSQATGCLAVLRIDLRDGAVIEFCGDGATTTAGAVGRIMRDLAAPQHVILPRVPEPSGAGVPQEVILISDDHTYVCGRLVDPPHHAISAICRSTPNLGLIVGLLRDAIEPDALGPEAGP